MNYIVVMPGHISFFDQYNDALEMKASFGGAVFNVYGLTYSKKERAEWAQSAY